MVPAKSYAHTSLQKQQQENQTFLKTVSPFGPLSLICSEDSTLRGDLPEAISKMLRKEKKKKKCPRIFQNQAWKPPKRCYPRLKNTHKPPLPPPRLVGGFDKKDASKRRQLPPPSPPTNAFCTGDPYTTSPPTSKNKPVDFPRNIIASSVQGFDSHVDIWVPLFFFFFPAPSTFCVAFDRRHRQKKKNVKTTLRTGEKSLTRGCKKAPPTPPPAPVHKKK